MKKFNDESTLTNYTKVAVFKEKQWLFHTKNAIIEATKSA